MKFWQRVDGTYVGQVEDGNVKYGDTRTIIETFDACYICGDSLHRGNPISTINCMDMCDKIIIRTCGICGDKYGDLKYIPKKYWYKPKTMKVKCLHKCIEYGEEIIDGIRTPFCRC